MYADFHIIRLLNHTHTHPQVLLNFPGVSPFGVVKGTPVACDKTNLNQDRWNLFLSIFLVVFLPFFLIADPFFDLFVMHVGGCVCWHEDKSTRSFHFNMPQMKGITSAHMGTQYE